MDKVFPPIPLPAGAALFRLHAIFRVACVFALMLCAFAPAQASEHGAEKKEGAVSLDVPIPNLTLSLMVEDRRVVGRLELSLQVHATDTSAAGKIEEMLPRIRDLLMTRVTPAPIPGTSNLSAETLTEMKSSILELLNQVVGANAVDAVYIVKAVTRRI
jgi:flagellar basal body-associated protein FliL